MDIFLKYKENPEGFEMFVQMLLENLLANKNIVNRLEELKENDTSFSLEETSNNKKKCCEN